MVKPIILIVDDERSLTDVGVEFLKLRMPEAEVYGALSGTEALKAIEAHKPNILLLDVNLNESMNGFIVLQKGLLANPAARYAIVTGNVDDWVESECHRAGVKRIVEKPLRLEDMLKMVREMVAELQ